ncbi:efflux RND transporter periplasmic adaptor subunit [Hassallia byssoidea VB512170]|uniref:Efflux RND transporter periplasmic adaptor subunit n=1 Tax=Hassallia byssoidea VB512170 TaxID=1304833 RepID=A0A846HDD5_9CYAN|nr:efflux RND transporter periplasmic adaptor subunit [Hassalia byssoidea]NEU74684.1 efflux RND transporter periplasmic adaptor subunit [Hassalia byssoidea VB512170]
MPHSDLPESPVSVETEHLTVIDNRQVEQEQEFVSEQPQPPKKRRWLMILGIMLIILGGAGVGWRWWQSRGNANSEAAAKKPMAIPVKLATVETGTIRESSEFIGSLEASRSVPIKPRIEGRISQVVVKEGDRIKQGQVIITLESDDVNAQLLQQKAALERAQANLAELKAGTRSEEIAQARAQVSQAEAKLRDAQSGSQPAEIQQAEAQVNSAQSDLELAGSRAKRYEQLRKEGAVSQDTLEGYQREQRSADAALIAAKKRLEQVRQSRGSDISELAGALEQQRQNLRQKENGSRPEEIAQARAQVTQAAAQVQAAQVQQQYTKVFAPFAGIIGAIPVKVGEYVSKGDQLTTLTKNDSLELNINIPLDQAKLLRLGLPVQMLDAQGKVTAGGRLSFISPNVNFDSQTVLTKATFTNFGGQLVNRQSVQTRVIWDQRPGILIPVTSISRLGGETFVFVAEAPEQPQAETQTLVAKQKPVKLGAIEGNNYQVIEGLKAGEKIIVSGILSLTNNAPIKPAPEEASN